MLLYGYLLFYIFVVFAVSYSATDSYLSNIQSGKHQFNKGTADIIVNSYSGPTAWNYDDYRITYKKAFTNVPQVLIGIHTLRNCQGINHHVSVFQSQIQNNMAFYAFKSLEWLKAGTSRDPNLKLLANYFAVSHPSSEIEINRYQLSSSSKNYQNSLTFLDDVNLATTYSAVFQQNLNCYVVNTLPFYLKVYRNVPDSTTILYHSDTNADPSTSSCSGLFVYRYAAITIKIQLTYQFRTNVIQATSVSQIVLYNIKQQSSKYFIGLTQFQSSTACVNLSLTTQKNQIQIASSNNLVKYQYFYLYQPYIQSITFYHVNNQFEFLFKQLSGWIASSDTVPSYFTTPVFSSTSNILKYTLSSNSISYNSQQSFKFKISNAPKFYYMTFSFKIPYISSMTVRVFDNSIKCVYDNIEQAVTTQNNFIYNDARIVSKSMFYFGSVTYQMTLGYTKNIIGSLIMISYSNNDGTVQSNNQIYFPSISDIKTSAITTVSSVLVSLSHSSLVTAPYIIDWQSSSYVVPHTFGTPSAAGDIEVNFSYLLNYISQDFTIRHKKLINAYIQFKIVTVQSINILVNTSTIILTLINLDTITQVSFSEITLSNTNLQKQSIQITNKKLLITLGYSSSDTGSSFNLLFSPTKINYKSLTNDLKIVQRFMYFQHDIYSHQINFTFKNVQSSPTIPAITLQFSTSALVYDSVVFNNNNDFVVKAKYTSTLHGMKLKLKYDTDLTTVYHELSSFDLVADPPVMYCIDPFQKQAGGYLGFSIFIVCLYWVTFVFCMFFCLKIYAVEMMFAFQFAFLSLIPVGVYCPPFSSLSFLRYSMGWNGINFNILQIPVNINYLALQIKSNLLSNINVMIFPIIISPLLYFLLNFLGQRNDSPRAKLKLLKYSKTFLFDIPLTIIFINLPNICMSFIVIIQSFGVTNILPFIIGIILILLSLGMIVIFIIYKGLFAQFKQEFNQKTKIFRISVQKSIAIRRMYPLLMFIEISTVSSIISVQFLQKMALIICLGIIILFSILMIMMMPYKQKIDNIRFISYRVLLIAICSIQVVFMFFRFQYAPRSSFVYDCPWIFLVLLVLLAIGLHLPYMIYKSINWIRNKDMIDISLINNPIMMKNKDFKPFLRPNHHTQSTNFMPPLEYSIHKKLSMEEKKKILLGVQKMHK